MNSTRMIIGKLESDSNGRRLAIRHRLENIRKGINSYQYECAVLMRAHLLAIGIPRD